MSMDEVTDLARIQELSVTGRYQECLQACRNILRINAEEGYVYKYKGKSLLALGQCHEAQKCLLNAHQLDESDPEISKDIGNSFLKMGDTVKALTWYEKALKVCSTYAPAINNIANIKREDGRFKEASELYRRAIQVDPNLMQAYFGAAAAFIELGDYDQAESFACQVLAINEHASGINEILGIIYQKKFNTDKAIECYRKELEHNPVSIASLSNMGFLLLQKGEMVTAVQLLEKVSALAPTDHNSLLLAETYQSLRKFDDAIFEYKKLNITKSSNKMILYNLGICLLEVGQNNSSIDAFKLALRLDGAFIAAWGNMGNALIKEGCYEEAIQAIQKVLDLDPDNATAHMNLGCIYKDLGELDHALESTLKSVSLKSDNPTAYLNLGGIYQELGQLDHALESTLKFLRLKPDNPTAYLNLGRIYMDLGNLDQALSSTLESLELKPDSPIAYMNLGVIYQDLGELNYALDATLKSLELKSDSTIAYMNLGVIYQDLGELNFALDATLRSIELQSDNSDAHMNLGVIYKDLGKADQSLFHLGEAMKNEKTKGKAAIELATIYLYSGRFCDAVSAISEIHSVKARNLLLSLYLCQDNKCAFNVCADELIGNCWLDQRGVAALEHANILYNQDLDNGMGGDILDSVFVQTIEKQELTNNLFNEMLIRLASGSLQSRSQTHLINGIQTSGNILDLPEVAFRTFKSLLVQKINVYNQICDINVDKDFMAHWEKNMYILKGWAIVMGKGGNLTFHNHESSWLTGTFYLQMPEGGHKIEEGAIEFSQQGPMYPKGSAVFERRVIRPKVRDLNIFSSSLFHRTLPFQSETKRVCIAFDVTRNYKMFDAFH